MPELIAPGTGQSAWVDFTVTQGAPRTLFLKSAAGDTPAPAGIDFELAHKTPEGRRNTVLNVNASNINDRGTIAAPGTYSTRRLASYVTDACGMDIEGT